MKQHRIQHCYRDDGLHFTDHGEEFLSLRYNGDVVIRSRAKNGSRHIHVTPFPGLLPWIISQLSKEDTDLWVGIYPLPIAASASEASSRSSSSNRKNTRWFSPASRSTPVASMS